MTDDSAPYSVQAEESPSENQSFAPLLIDFVGKRGLQP